MSGASGRSGGGGSHQIRCGPLFEGDRCDGARAVAQARERDRERGREGRGLSPAWIDSSARAGHARLDFDNFARHGRLQDRGFSPVRKHPCSPTAPPAHPRQAMARAALDDFFPGVPFGSEHANSACWSTPGAWACPRATPSSCHTPLLPRPLPAVSVSRQGYPLPRGLPALGACLLYSTAQCPGLGISATGAASLAQPGQEISASPRPLRGH